MASAKPSYLTPGDFKPFGFWTALFKLYEVTESSSANFIQKYKSFKTDVTTDCWIYQILGVLKAEFQLLIENGRTRIYFTNTIQHELDYKCIELEEVENGISYKIKDVTMTEKKLVYKVNDVKADLDNSKRLKIPVSVAICMLKSGMQQLVVDIDINDHKRFFEFFLGKRIPRTLTKHLNKTVINTQFKFKFYEALMAIGHMKVPRRRDIDDCIKLHFSKLMNALIKSDVKGGFFRMILTLPSSFLYSCKGIQNHDYKKLIREKIPLQDLLDWCVEKKTMSSVLSDVEQSCRDFLEKHGLECLQEPKAAITTMMEVGSCFERSAKILATIEHLFYLKETKGDDSIIWSYNVRDHFENLKTAIKRYQKTYGGDDMLDFMNILEITNNVESALSYVNRMQGFIAEAILCKTYGNHYIDETSKWSLAEILEQNGHSILKKQDVIKGIGRSLVENVCTRIIGSGKILQVKPDNWHISGKTLVLQEFGCISSDEGLAAKKKHDEMRWKMIECLEPYFRIKVHVEIVKPHQLIKSIKRWERKWDMSAELDMLNSFLKLANSLRGSRKREKQYERMELEDEQRNVNMLVNKTKIHPVVEKDAEKKNVDCLLEAKDHYLTGDHVVPPGARRMLEYDIETYRGTFKLFEDEDILSCIMECNSRDPKSIGLFGKKQSYEDLVEQLKSKLSTEVNYRRNDVKADAADLILGGKYCKNLKDIGGGDRCTCLDNEKGERMSELISSLCRFGGPGGKVTKDPIVKLKDKVSRLAVSYVFGGTPVELVSKTGKLIKCFKGNQKSLHYELMGALKQSLSADGSDQNILDTVTNLFEDGKINIEDLKKIQEHTKDRSSFFDMVCEIIKLHHENVRPCHHSRVVIDAGVAQAFRNNIGSVMDTGGKTATTLKISKLDEKLEDTSIRFDIIEDFLKDHMIERVSSKLTESRLFLSELSTLCISKIHCFLSEPSISNDLKIVQPNVNWIVELLTNNKWFQVIMAEHQIAESMDKVFQMTTGVMVKTLSQTFNLVVDNISSDGSQVVYFIQNRLTGEMSRAQKIEKRLNSAKILALPLLVVLIANSLEMRNMVNLEVSPQSYQAKDKSEERMCFLQKRTAMLQRKLLDKDFSDYLEIFDGMIAKNEDSYEKVNNMIMYFCNFVHPVICENNKQLNGLMQMARYFYSSSYACKMDLKGLMGKMAVPIRGAASQRMYAILVGCFLKNCKSSVNFEIKDKCETYFEKGCVKHMTDYYCNLMPIENSSQFISVIYYVHAFERMEMDGRQTMNAYNMLCDKAIEWKFEFNECAEKLCQSCWGKLFMEDTGKSNLVEVTTPLSAMSQKIFMSCSECEKVLLELECFLGYQIMRRESMAHAKKCLAEKLFYCSDKNSKYAFHCWEMSQQIGAHSYNNVNETDLEELFSEKKMFNEVSALMSTTNTVPKFSERFDPIRAKNMILKIKADKAMKNVQRKWKVAEKNLKQQNGRKPEANEILTKMNSELFEGLDDDSSFVNACKNRIEMYIRSLDGKSREGKFGGFEDFCRNYNNSFCAIMKDWYTGFKAEKISGKGVSNELNRTRRLVDTRLQEAVESQRIFAANDKVDFIEKELGDPNSESSKARNLYRELCSNSKTQISLIDSECVLQSGKVNEIPEIAQSTFKSLYKEILSIRKLEEENPGVDFHKEKAELHSRVLEARDSYKESLMKSLINVCNRMFKYSVRWMYDRKIGNFIDAVVHYEDNAYLVEDLDNLTVIEWFACCMFQNDYDLEGLFFKDLSHKNVPEQIRSLMITMDPRTVACNMIRLMDSAIHSSTDKFNSYLSKKSEKLINTASEKVVIALAKVALESGISSIAEFCKRACEDPKILFRCRVAVKQQFALVRDLAVLELAFRILQYFVELSAKQLLKSQSHDMMMNIDRKDTFLNSCQEDYSKMMREEDFKAMSLAGDCSSWGPKHTDIAFLTCLSGTFEKNGFIGSCFRNFMIKACHKQVYFNDGMAKKMMSMLAYNNLDVVERKIKNGSQYKVVDKHGVEVTYQEAMDKYKIPQEVAHVIYFQVLYGDGYFSTGPHMMQGISHMVSSLYHCYALNYVDRLLELSKLNLKVDSICSSDDYSIKFSAKNASITCFFRDVMMFEKIRRTMSLGYNIKDSEKSLWALLWVSEIYSQFATPITRLSPYIKQLCAMVTAPGGITPLDENSLTWEMSKNLFEAGASIFSVNVAILARNIKNSTITNSQILKSYDLLSTRQISHYTGWCPWINNVRAMSIADVCTELADVIIENTLERIEDAMTRKETDLSDLIAVTSIIAKLDEDFDVRNTQAITKSQNVIGNPVRFKPPIKLEKLRERLNVISKEKRDMKKDDLIETLVFANQKAFNFESAISKFRQALGSNSIIYNLIGFNNEAIRNMSRMCRGGYYWEKPDQLDAPNLVFSSFAEGKKVERRFVSISHLSSWKFKEDCDWGKLYKKALELFKMAKKTDESLRNIIEKEVSCLTDGFVQRNEVKMVKRTFYRSGVNKPLKNDAYEIMAYIIDPQATLSKGSEIKFASFDNDVKIIETIKPGFIAKTVEAFKNDEVKREDCRDLLSTCGLLRDNKSSKMNIYLQDSNRLKFSTGSEMIVRGKIMHSRLYNVTSSVSVKRQGLNEKIQKIYEKLTVLNQLNPNEFDLEESFESLCEKTSFLQDVNEAMIESNVLPNHSGHSRVLSDVLKAFNKSAISNVSSDIGVSTVLLEGGQIQLDKFYMISGQKSERKEKILLCKYDRGFLTVTTNVKDEAVVCQLIHRYVDINKQNERQNRPTSAHSFFTQMVSVDRAYIKVCMNLNEICPYSKNRQMIKYKGINFEFINTTSYSGEKYREIANYQGAVKQNKMSGLTFGHFSKPSVTITIEQMMQAVTNESPQPNVEKMISKLNSDEFIEERCVKDSMDVSLETLTYMQSLLKERERKEREDFDFDDIEISTAKLAYVHRIATRFIVDEVKDTGFSAKKITVKARNSDYYEPLQKQIAAVNNLLRYGKTSKWGVSTCLRFLKNILIGCPAGEEEGRLTSFLNTARQVEDNLKFSAKADLNLIFGDKFIKSKFSESDSKSVAVNHELDAKYRISQHNCYITLYSHTDYLTKRFKNVNKHIGEQILKSGSSRLAADMSLKLLIQKNKKRSTLTLECKITQLNFIEPIMAYLTAPRPDLSVLVQSFSVIGLMNGLIDFPKYLSLLLDLSLYEENESIKSKSLTDASGDTDIEEENADDDKEKYYYMAACELISSPNLPEVALLSMLENSMNDPEDYQDFRERWSRYQSSLQSNGIECVSEGKIREVMKEIERDHPEWFRSLRDSDVILEDDEDMDDTENEQAERVLTWVNKSWSEDEDDEEDPDEDN